MKKLMIAALGLSMLSGTVVLAQNTSTTSTMTKKTHKSKKSKKSSDTMSSTTK